MARPSRPDSSIRPDARQWVITLLNKYDRPGRDPLELLDEIEEQIGLRPTPATWPVGISGEFRGVIDRRTGEFTRFTRTTRGSAIAPEEIVPAERAAIDEGKAWHQAQDESGLTGLNIGDSLYEETPVTFPPIPRFSPEVFASARPLDTGKSKQFRKGLAQLDEEGRVGEAAA